MRHTIRLTFFVFLTVAVLCFAVAPGITQEASGGTIIWGVKTEATGIDVQTNGQSPSRQLFNFVYEQLVDWMRTSMSFRGWQNPGNNLTILLTASICGEAYAFPMVAR